jgi:lysophospholipase L1-like esterase
MAKIGVLLSGTALSAAGIPADDNDLFTLVDNGDGTFRFDRKQTLTARDYKVAAIVFDTVTGDIVGKAGTFPVTAPATPEGTPPVNSYNWSPNAQFTHLRPSLTAVRSSTAGTRCGIAILGDSTSAAFGSPTTAAGTGDPNTGARQNAYASFMADSLNAAGLVTSKQSFFSNGNIGGADSRVTLLPNTAYGGPNAFGSQFIIQTAAGGGFDFIPGGTTNFDRLDVCYLDVGDPFTVAINGGTAQTITPGVTQTIKKATLTVPSTAGTATINVRYPTNNITPFVSGITPWLSTGASVEVWNGGISGYTMQAYSDPSTAGSGNMGLSQVIAMAPKLAIISLGINDANGGRAAADFQTDTTNLVTSLQNAGIDVLLVVETPTQEGGYPQIAFGTPASPGPYTLALQAVATARNVPLIDLNARYQSWTNLNNQGWMYDNLHPNKKLHADLGPFYASVIASLAGAAASAINGVVFEGDSITQGAAASNPATTSYPAVFASRTGLPVSNNGKYGDQLAIMDGNYANDLAPLYNAANLNTLSLFAGTNDIGDAGKTDVDVRGYRQSLMGKAKTTGYLRVATTLISRADGNWNSTKEGYRQADNTWVRANWQTIAEYFVDVDAIPETQDPTNTTYFADRIHPTDALYAIIAEAFRVALGVPLASAPPVSAPSTYTLTGPSTATVGSASTAFTVAVSGTLASAVTVTPSDSGAGGTFTPASVSLGTTANASASFTYTPAGSAGSRTISTTNNGGLTNPAAKTLTVSAAQPASTDQYLRLPWLNNGGLIEAVDGSGYTYTGNGSDSFFAGGYGASSKQIPANTAGYIGATSVNLTDAHNILIGLSTNAQPTGFGQIQYFVYLENNNYNFSGGSKGATVTPAIGDKIRMRTDPTAGSIYCEVSQDSGSTWTIVNTWSGVSLPAFFAGYGTGGVNSKIKLPFGSANVA